MPKLKWSAKDIPSKCAAIAGQRTAWTFEGVDRLMLECMENGQRIWKVRYQVNIGGRRIERKYEIGRLDPETRRALGSEDQNYVLAPGQARDKATAVLVRVDSGEDPWLAARQAKHQPASTVRTVESVYREWLDNPKRKRRLRPRTRDEYERIFKQHLKPRLGSTDIGSLEKKRIAEVLDQIRRKTTSKKKGHRGLQSTKALKLLFSIGKFAADKEYVVRNPAHGIEPPVPENNPDGKQHRPPTDDELRLIWIEGPNHLDLQHARALRLAILLGKRVSELTGAEKTELQLDIPNPYWLIPGAREGNKAREDQLVPLPPLAAKIFKEAIAESGDSPFVFQGRRRAHKPISRHTPSHAFKELRRALGVGDNIRLHDCRSLIVDQMAKLGVPSEYRSHVLHHTGDMRATLADRAYSTYDYEPEKRRALTLWEDRLLEIVFDKKPSGLRW